MAFITPTLLRSSSRSGPHHGAISPRVAPRMTLNVLLAGAAGRTGAMVFELLRSAPGKFSVAGLVRDVASAAEKLGSDAGLVQGDVRQADTLEPHMVGKDAVIVLSSARSRVVSPATDTKPRVSAYDVGQFPEDVDWGGGRNIVDLAKKHDVKHIVFVGSMGGTMSEHPLNKINNGNILLFKRKAEQYLIDSGVPYTIINPGGLLQDPQPGERELIVSSGDALFGQVPQNEISIPMADVASLVVSALTTPAARNKALDVIAKQSGVGIPTADVAVVFDLAGSVL